MTEKFKMPFESYPKLASYLERLANTNCGMTLIEWSDFLAEVNASILSAERHGLERAAEWHNEEKNKLEEQSDIGPVEHRQSCISLSKLHKRCAISILALARQGQEDSHA